MATPNVTVSELRMLQLAHRNNGSVAPRDAGGVKVARTLQSAGLGVLAEGLFFIDNSGVAIVNCHPPLPEAA